MVTVYDLFGPPAKRYCWFCGESLEGFRPQKITCNATCRKRWSRLIARVKAQKRLPLPLLIR